ncbi:MAG: rhomboid family intramembrane serine protease [Bacteroidaceae bacterium]|nr:rhomboid family intramembrane serine protease [Bacteroidaceae bacterium]
MFRNLPTVTKNLLIINFLVWMGTLAAMRLGIDVNSLLGLHFFKASNFRLYQLFTYMFLHDGFYHVFCNMFAVFMFGSVMERTWGSQRFLFFYIACGLGAGITQECVQWIHYMIEFAQYQEVSLGGTIIPMSEYLNLINTVGASGAVYGILLGYGMAYPNQPLFIIPFPFPIKAKWLVTGYVVLELMMGLGGRPGDNVAHFAHLGGMLFAFLIIRYWRKNNIFF